MDCLNVSCSKESQRPFQRPLHDAIVYAKSILRQFLHHKTFSAVLKKSKLIKSVAMILLLDKCCDLFANLIEHLNF